MQEFFATEPAFRSVLLLLNLLAEFQRAVGLLGYRAPATICAQVLTFGAILGRAGRRLVVHLSQCWGGLNTRIPLLDSILNWQIPTSLKLDSVFATWAPTASQTAIQGPRKGGRSALDFGIQNHWPLLAEGHLTRRLLGAMVRRTAGLWAPAG